MGGGQSPSLLPPLSVPPLPSSPRRPSALGAGLRLSRDLTSGAGVPSSPRASPPSGSPRSVLRSPQPRGGGYRYVAGGERPSPVQTAPLPRPPPLAALPCSRFASAARRRRCAEEQSTDAREPGSARASPGAGLPSPRAAVRGGGGGAGASSPSDPRPPAPAAGDGAGLRPGGGGGGGGPRPRPRVAPGLLRPGSRRGRRGGGGG